MNIHQKLEFKTCSFIKRTPALCFALSKMQKGKEWMLVDANTDLCVEGSPKLAKMQAQHDGFDVYNYDFMLTIKTTLNPTTIVL